MRRKARMSHQDMQRAKRRVTLQRAYGVARRLAGTGRISEQEVTRAKEMIDAANSEGVGPPAQARQDRAEHAAQVYLLKILTAPFGNDSVCL